MDGQTPEPGKVQGTAEEEWGSPRSQQHSPQTAPPLLQRVQGKIGAQTQQPRPPPTQKAPQQSAPSHPDASMDGLGRDPFSSQSQEEPLTPREACLDMSPLSVSPDRAVLFNNSPASSTDRQMAEIAEIALSQNSSIQPQTSVPTAYSGDAVLLARFSALLQQELSKACTIITTGIKDDFQNIGERLDTIDSKMDGTIKRVNQNSRMISSLQDQLDQANAKIEDLENRSRRYNFRVRGLPESINDLEEVVHDLMKDLIPDFATHQLELDRVHRALTAPRPDGLPRDVIVKPHFYRVKEKIMLEARNKSDISLQGNKVQIFADISQATIQKRRQLKPLLTHLINHQIKYRWSFPFRLSFTYRGKSHSFASFQSGEELLLELGIINRDSHHPESPNDDGRPVSPLWSQQRRSNTRKSHPFT